MPKMMSRPYRSIGFIEADLPGKVSRMVVELLALSACAEADSIRSRRRGLISTEASATTSIEAAGLASMAALAKAASMDAPASPSIEAAGLASMLVLAEA